VGVLAGFNWIQTNSETMETMMNFSFFSIEFTERFNNCRLLMKSPPPPALHGVRHQWNAKHIHFKWTFGTRSTFSIPLLRHGYLQTIEGFSSLNNTENHWFCLHKCNQKPQYISVRVTGYKLDSSVLIPGKHRTFLFIITAKPSVRGTGCSFPVT
jgi:hypothetical protein